MAKVSICIEMVLTEHDLYDRPARAAQAGFSAVEFWNAAGKDVGRLKAACDEAAVSVAAFLAPAPAPLVQQQPAGELVAMMKDSAALASRLGTGTLIVTVGNTLEGVSQKMQTDDIIVNLKAVAPVAEDAGLKLAVEPLNTLVDHKGYFLAHTAHAREIVDRVGSPAVGLLYDAYHMQIMEGNLIETIRRNADVIHHVHVADVPGRCEPGTGEISYANVLKALDETGYRGWCGFEFRPSDNSEAALRRATRACGLA